MKVIVTGGAGYIGSHACQALYKRGFVPVVIDNLYRGHKDFVKWGKLYQTDVLDTESLKEIFQIENPAAVMHFAALAYVGESVNEPEKYYRNNIEGTKSLLRAMKETNIKKLIFSSTCATYGTPKEIPITEKTPQAPINPYGESKLKAEEAIKDYVRREGFSAIALRYFNAAGSDPGLEIGEKHNPETHLIPLAIAAALDEKAQLTVFGDDYPTKDGTCVRDYIHVCDLVDAHIKALQKILTLEGFFSAYNLGTGSGHSIREVIETIEKELNKKVKFNKGPRREGDPAVLVADYMKAHKELGWTPEHNLANIILTASRWYKKLNNISI